MNGIRPLIGVTPGFDYEKDMAYIKRGYCEGVNQAGGIAILLPAATDEEILAGALKRCDGLLVTGGPDVDARLYGEVNMPYNGTISPVRDYSEIFLVKKAIEANIPVLGICRGMQVMNVAMGGSLYQDIHSQIEGRIVLKHSQDAPKWYPTHDIYIEKGSRIRAIFEENKLRVNSFHHQSVKVPAPGFLSTSLASDDIIEAIEFGHNVFTVGVQWHPELMWAEDRLHLKLFEAFIEAAGKNNDRIKAI